MDKPSLRDVARRAGVGTTTVSRVLNQHPNISDTTRARVTAAIEQLGYVPDVGARHFRLGRTHAVSALLPMIGTPFYETLLTALHGPLEAQGYDLALFPLLGSQRVRRFRDASALAYRADALLIVSQHPDELYGGPPPFRGPTVLLDAQHPTYHSVSFDNHSAGRLAAEYALGRRLPIVFLDGADAPGAPGSPVFVARRAGIVQTLGRHGIRPVLTVSVLPEQEGLRLAAQQIAARRPPGPFLLLAMTDDLALGVRQHLHDSGGLRLGEDYLLLGFDGSAAAAAAGLSSVVQPVQAMGEAAASVLLEALRGELNTLVQRQFSPTLREDRSTALQADPQQHPT
ncbi:MULTISPECIES: LacI family DNA-binding transcriptional regulator [Deinococcus]|uniref:LacI family DNA-binding transcriptional regulator n=1 Tax=Deinococcus rufus TaxID=2136097 RepID=A0ABV7Z534_9DEIO|nr:LacI family DNA-binding transcriptional regulator [Deinococcus sp. AB2017081]WQE95979.1 LacI family DNA-binding transcriptional regulator [Deinococcus sp. AB2017081]